MFGFAVAVEHTRVLFGPGSETGKARSPDICLSAARTFAIHHLADRLMADSARTHTHTHPLTQQHIASGDEAQQPNPPLAVRHFARLPLVPQPAAGRKS